MKTPSRNGNTRSFTIADLFAGAGGITEGFREAGFVPVVAVESDKWAAASYLKNFGDHVLASPIENVEVSRLEDGLNWDGADASGQPKRVNTPHIDVLVGGPPCQGFSPLGRMTDWEKSDPRNRLWRDYMQVVETIRPQVFVVENVPELLRSAEFESLKNRAEKKLDYELSFGVLNAVNYGVPQVRRRAIIIGSRIGKVCLPPETLERRTVRDAIGDLPLKPTGEDMHLPRKPTKTSMERYKCVPPGGNRFDLMRKRPDITPRCWLEKPTGSTDVFGRMEWGKPSPTIRTEFFKPEKGRYLHPKAHRPITLREAARLQTFPDSFVFVGAPVQVAKQIGNAVPVQLAWHIALHIRAALESASKHDRDLELIEAVGA